MCYIQRVLENLDDRVQGYKKVTGQVRVDEQHRRIRNLQANSDSAFVAHPPTD
jgi:hypothetical protein